MELLDDSLAEVSEKRHSEDGYDRTIFVWPSFSVQHCMYWTDVSVRYQLTNQLATCVDTSKLYFILGTDIALPRDYVKR